MAGTPRTPDRCQNNHERALTPSAHGKDIRRSQINDGISVVGGGIFASNIPCLQTPDAMIDRVFARCRARTRTLIT